MLKIQQWNVNDLFTKLPEIQFIIAQHKSKVKHNILI